MADPITISRGGGAPAAEAAASGRLERHAAQLDADQRDTVAEWANTLRERLHPQVERYQERVAEAMRDPQVRDGMARSAAAPATTGAGALAGSLVLPANYLVMDCFTTGPFLIGGPFRPHKIIPAGQLAVLFGVIFVNPVPLVPVPPISGTTLLGSRPYTACFETVNITNVTEGPETTISDVFGGPAAAVTVEPMVFVGDNPAPNAKTLYSTHFSVDISDPGQPFAAFSSNHFDPDGEPPFLGVPPAPPGFHHNMPAKYLVAPF